MTAPPTLGGPPLSDAASADRTRFFPGQLVVADDLTQDQLYLREKQRRHNRLLHGWGIVGGAEVSVVSGSTTVTVGAGFILGPWGDEIGIDGDLRVDLSAVDVDGNAIVAGAGPLWTTPITVTRQPGQLLYLAIRHDEQLTAPVSVPATGCGCDAGSCEYTRIRDGFVLRALPGLPVSYDPMPTSFDETSFPSSGASTRPLAAVPTDPWVILADITMASDSAVADVDVWTHRRYVSSSGAGFTLVPRPAQG